MLRKLPYIDPIELIDDEKITWHRPNFISIFSTFIECGLKNFSLFHLTLLNMNREEKVKSVYSVSKFFSPIIYVFSI